MNERILKRVFNADVLALLLVSAAIQVLLYGLEAVLRGTQTRDLFRICLIAAGVGFYGASSRWNGKWTSAGVALLGLASVWILGARIADPLVELIRSLVAMSPRILPQIGYRFDIDLTGLTSAWNAIAISSSALMTRIYAGMPVITETSRLHDALLRNMFWTFNLWLLSAWIGWYAARRNGMTSLLPGVLLLTILIGSTERRVEALWALVIIMLLLMGLWNYKSHIQHWEHNHFDYSESIRLDIGQSILVVTVIVGLISYFTPSISWQDIRDYFRERERSSQNEEVVQPSNDPNAPQSEDLGPRSFLPREHLLTSGSAQSEDIVMTIKTGELSPVPLPSLGTSAPRYYWRSIVYDQYDGRGWFTSSAPSQFVSANQPIIAGVLSSYKLLPMDVQLLQPEGKLFWSGMLYNADIPLTVDWRLRPQSSLFADQTALLQADMFAARTRAASYQAETFVPTPSIEQLRAASAVELPEYIHNRYLLLPDAVPERVHRLARQITEGQPTTYDKAKAIETYLRTNYPYDLEIPAPPEDQDVADYFLFDLKRGYCDYYATAMVVLARSSGIPARFVSGYASGDYDPSTAQYVVRELHAHSWPEVYFPEIGWVEFEPTGSQPEIQRNATNSQGNANNESEVITRNIFYALTGWKINGILIPLAVVLMTAVAYSTFIEPFFLARKAPAAAVEILYQRFYRAARPLVGESTRAETVHEFTDKLAQKIELINSELNRSPRLLQQDVTDLASIYQMSLFSEHEPTRQDLKHAIGIWNRLRWSLIVERLKVFYIRNKWTP